MRLLERKVLFSLSYGRNRNENEKTYGMSSDSSIYGTSVVNIQTVYVCTYMQDDADSNANKLKKKKKRKKEKDEVQSRIE